MKLVKEYISFERGVDPKNILGIGQRYLIEKWLEENQIENYIINGDMSIDVNGEVDFYGSKLENFPDYIQFNIVIGNFSLQDNNFTSLKGCPRIIGKAPSKRFVFSCSQNNLSSLEYCPKEVHGEFFCYGNNRFFSKKEVNDLCYVAGDIQNKG
jgi:hypothetical protein